MLLARQFVEEIGQLTSLTGENGLEIIDSLGLPLDRIVEILGVDLVNLTSEQSGIIGSLSENFNVSIADLASTLGVELGSINDATSLLNDGFEEALNGLPPEVSGPLIDALREVERTGDVTPLIGLIADLPAEYANELAPFFDEINAVDSVQEGNQLLASIDTGVGDVSIAINTLGNSISELASAIDGIDFTSNVNVSVGGSDGDGTIQPNIGELPGSQGQQVSTTPGRSSSLSNQSEVNLLQQISASLRTQNTLLTPELVQQLRSIDQSTSRAADITQRAAARSAREPRKLITT